MVSGVYCAVDNYSPGGVFDGEGVRRGGSAKHSDRDVDIKWLRQEVLKQI